MLGLLGGGGAPCSHVDDLCCAGVWHLSCQIGNREPHQLRGPRPDHRTGSAIFAGTIVCSPSCGEQRRLLSPGVFGGPILPDPFPNGLVSMLEPGTPASSVCAPGRLFQEDLSLCCMFMSSLLFTHGIPAATADSSLFFCFFCSFVSVECGQACFSGINALLEQQGFHDGVLQIMSQSDGSVDNKSDLPRALLRLITLVLSARSELLAATECNRRGVAPLHTLPLLSVIHHSFLSSLPCVSFTAGPCFLLTLSPCHYCSVAQNFACSFYGARSPFSSLP